MLIIIGSGSPCGRGAPVAREPLGVLLDGQHVVVLGDGPDVAVRRRSRRVRAPASTSSRRGAPSSTSCRRAGRCRRARGGSACPAVLPRPRTCPAAWRPHRGCVGWPESELRKGEPCHEPRRLRVFDCDNHYYEAIDAFTRHVEPGMAKRTMQWAEINGKQRLLVGGKVNRFIPNPTFDPISKPGALDEYFRGRNPKGEGVARAVRRARPAERAPRVPRPRRPAASSWTSRA